MFNRGGRPCSEALPRRNPCALVPCTGARCRTAEFGLGRDDAVERRGSRDEHQTIGGEFPARVLRSLSSVIGPRRSSLDTRPNAYGWGTAGRDACATAWRAGPGVAPASVPARLDEVGQEGWDRGTAGRDACATAWCAGPGVAPASVPARLGPGRGAGGIGDRRQGRLRHGMACWTGRGAGLRAGEIGPRAGERAGPRDRKQGRLRHGMACRTGRGAGLRAGEVG